MSATLDAAPVAELLDDAPVVTSDGRAFQVDTRWLDRPLPQGSRLERGRAPDPDRRRRAVETGGTVLVFLPGEGEIRRVMALLSAHGSRHPAAVRRAGRQGPARRDVGPGASGGEVVLATAIAETSLTIPTGADGGGCGAARRARFDPGSGMSRLVTERVSRAEADQRRGRAGRVAPGICYRLWARVEEGALPAYAPRRNRPWRTCRGWRWSWPAGGPTPPDLAFLSPRPPKGRCPRTRSAARRLEALDAGRAHHRSRPGPGAAAAAPAPGAYAGPGGTGGGRSGGAAGGPRPPARRGRGPGVAPDRHPRPQAVPEQVNRQGVQRMPRRGAPPDAARWGTSPRCRRGRMAALAYPDRIGLRRKGDDARFVLSGGKGAVIDKADVLAGQRLIVAADLDGDPREASIRMAATLERGRAARPSWRPHRPGMHVCLNGRAATAGCWPANRTALARWCWPTASGATPPTMPLPVPRWRVCA